MILFVRINIIIFVLLTIYHFYNLKYEKKYITQILAFVKDDVLIKQLSHDLNWYIVRIYYYKYVYYFLSVLIIEINAIIPVLNTSLKDEKRAIISLISVIATISAGVVSFTKCSESWIKHRNTYENIKYEIENYINNLDKYKDKNKAKNKFCERYAELKYKDLAQWLILRTEEDKCNDSDNKNEKENNK
ncbi:hypothetical protein N486_10645 [Clostridium botulinum B2 128]|uniref:DUF4231 domain-containing protein n=1 Tax=Clostridium botulinum TaxID=1491 RepID=UPI0007DFDEFC|nr:DUF4231 domain-containing protein [Clostridium botulinum]KEI76192.1 hypothetical protein N486_10645 [Clostridium botulinum B2 128]NEZ74034.1 DUF4231 domain-containing protein [Clostridium botulinum]NEZ98014.1 DUF4231 domain-containing protein [Clostridium botulinum]NFA30750.1 DUF4231 domain-containing protein [Clostridium botulinum]NFA83835.1 DUF4231 domain-containing protein [Clostridium botulinum]